MWVTPTQPDSQKLGDIQIVRQSFLNKDIIRTTQRVFLALKDKAKDSGQGRRPASSFQRDQPKRHHQLINTIYESSMASPHLTGLSESFAILTTRLIIIPTPIAVHIASYRALYGALHADTGFCRMGFGERFPVRNRNDDETRDMIETRDIKRCWQRRGLGDFAVGLRPQPGTGDSDQNSNQDPRPGVSELRGEEFQQFMGPDMARLEEIRWVGYSGVRDATTTSIPPREEGDTPLPNWLEMVELRYGVSPEFWGKGIAQEASGAIMQWAICEKGAKRFIADTERDNQRSGRVLQKLGFTHSGTNYWKELGEVVEWELLHVKE